MKSQYYRQTQQTSQNTYEKPVNSCGLPSSSCNPDGPKERQEPLKPRHQLGIDPCGKVTNRSLVGSAPSLKRQDERVDGSYDSQDEETQRNDPKRSAEDA